MSDSLHGEHGVLEVGGEGILTTPSEPDLTEKTRGGGDGGGGGAIVWSFQLEEPSLGSVPPPPPPLFFSEELTVLGREFTWAETSLAELVVVGSNPGFGAASLLGITVVTTLTVAPPHPPPPPPPRCLSFMAAGGGRGATMDLVEEVTLHTSVSKSS